jgi:hypothetical protein
MSNVRIEVAGDDVFISFVLFCKPGPHNGKNKNPPEIPAGFQKNVLIRSEIPPKPKKMPRYAFWRGGGNHRLGWFHEHFDGILWQLLMRVNFNHNNR